MRIITLRSISSDLEMFDGFTDTQTVESERIQQSFDCSGCNAVIILNTYGITATLSVSDQALSFPYTVPFVFSDNGDQYQTQTISLIRDSIKDWWDYLFAPCRTGRDAVFYFQARENAIATITIDYPGGTAKCGICLLGVAEDAGNTLYGINIGITDYSLIDTNDFGVSYLSQGAWAKRIGSDVNIRNNCIDGLYRTISANRGTPAVFDFNKYSFPINTPHTSLYGLPCLIVYGYLERFSLSVDNSVVNKYGIDVKGLI